MGLPKAIFFGKIPTRPAAVEVATAATAAAALAVWEKVGGGKSRPRRHRGLNLLGKILTSHLACTVSWGTAPQLLPPGKGQIQATLRMMLMAAVTSAATSLV